MLASDLREKYLKFFEDKGHKRIPSAPLIPEHDPTVLFTTAGMHPLVPFLLGEKHPLGTRLCSSQKCIRTGDIDDVGDATHLTFFEMLGNWSLGDYFKKEAIEWSFEFLTKELGVPKERLAFSVFEGDKENNILKDEEAADIWKNLGVSEKRITYLGRSDNWWGPAGKTGPCGPDTEMFYWAGPEPAKDRFDPNDTRWVEIWNDVFMQYNKASDGCFEPLTKKNVDTGMGLERMAALLQGKDNVYDTELFLPILEKISQLSGKAYQDDAKSFRIIADHLRASIFILADGLAPSNTERGYVLRRLIRRAIRYGRLLGIEKEFTVKIAQRMQKIYEDAYPELIQYQEFIFEELSKEEEKFGRTLNRGLKEFDKSVRSNISGPEAFNLYQSYGFPVEMTIELAKERGKNVDEAAFKEELQRHQALSRTASAGQFKSGLADNSEQTTRYHTATHLLLAALREVLGDEVIQKGSNITAERIRFDFSFNRKITAEEIKKVEDLVNEKIQASLPVVCEEMETGQAKERGAMGVFGHKYGDRVKVYTIKQGENICSQEICAGPHVQNTRELGEFKIIKEEASSAGIRRIKATLT
ncbi:MAG: alanine--tRNA ligase [Candidatus Pacebacteria bacterium]|nr:alanine--tRNA ligase [Candidatus Paceibacterota bacterium]